MSRAVGIQAITLVAGQTAFTIDLRGRHAMAIYVPALGTATTVSLQPSHDNGTTKKSLKDTTPAVVGQWASSSGDFWLDGDTLARFYGVPYLSVVLGAAQGGDVVFQVALSQG